MEEQIDVSQRIYDYASKEIEAYCSQNGHSMREQYEIFASIASQVSAYLMGSAISSLPPEDQEEELHGLEEDIRRISAFLQANAEKERKKNK